MKQALKHITEQIEAGEFYYIFDLEYDAIESQLRMSFCENPDKIAVALTLIFHEIVEFHNTRYHDPGDRCLAELHNYEFVEDEQQLHVTVNTGDSVLRFVSLAEPEVMHGATT